MSRTGAATKQNTGKKQGVGPGNPPEHTRWKKGESGNPKGRPEGSLNWSTVFAKIYESGITPDQTAELARAGIKPKQGEKLTKKHLVALANFSRAYMTGDTRALRAAVEIMEGPINRVQVNNTGDGSITVVVGSDESKF